MTGQEVVECITERCERGHRDRRSHRSVPIK
jgi:hypothetical protein